MAYGTKYDGQSVRPVYTPAQPTSSDLLPGKFTVNSFGKQVQFTKGNLYWDGENFHVESDQTAYPSSWNACHVGHFYWSKEASVAYAETYSDDGMSTTDVFFCGENNKLTIDGQSDLNTLSRDEWEYLFQSRFNASSLYKCGVSITTSAGTVSNCVVIAPNGWDYTNNPLKTSYGAVEWAAAEASGLVCLPATGCRNGSSLSFDGSCACYWSATPSGNEYGQSSSAYCMYSNGSKVVPSSNHGRSNGYSVRLVKDGTPTYTEGTYTGKAIRVNGLWWAPVNCGYTSELTYGKLYQFGRKVGTTYGSSWESPFLHAAESNPQSYEATNPTTTEPEDGKFYKGDDTYNDWYASQNLPSWPMKSGDTGYLSGKIDNPCPSGWRVPTYEELNALFNNNTSGWTTNVSGQNGFYFNGTSTCTSSTEGEKVFLPAAGCRDYLDGNAYSRGGRGGYWSSSVGNEYARYLRINNSNAAMSYSRRALGCSVRCVQE